MNTFLLLLLAWTYVGGVVGTVLQVKTEYTLKQRLLYLAALGPVAITSALIALVHITVLGSRFVNILGGVATPAEGQQK